MIAMPVAGTVLAAIWLVLHSATSLMLETFGSLANVNGLAASRDTTVEWGFIWLEDCWTLSPLPWTFATHDTWPCLTAFKQLLDLELGCLLPRR